MASAIEKILILGLVLLVGIGAYDYFRHPSRQNTAAHVTAAPSNGGAFQTDPAPVPSVQAPTWVEATVADIEYVRNTGGHCYSIENTASGPRVKPLPCKQLNHVGEVGIADP